MFDEVQWGDVATWVSSVITLIAVAAAFVAIRQQRRESEIARRQTQLALAIGVSAEVFGPRDNARGHRSWPVTVHNATGAPIFGCALMMPRSDGVFAKSTVGTVPAGKSITLAAANDPGRYVDLGFADSEGRYWVRRWTGSLIRVPLPPGPLIVGGPQAFEVAEYLDPQPPGLEKAPALITVVEKWAETTGLLDLRAARKRRDQGLVPD